MCTNNMNGTRTHQQKKQFLHLSQFTLNCGVGKGGSLRVLEIVQHSSSCDAECLLGVGNGTLSAGRGALSEFLGTGVDVACGVFWWNQG